MQTHVLRALVTFLFLLSLLNWFYVPYLTAWELSIVTSELGAFFAIVTFMGLIGLKPWRLIAPPFRPFDVLFIALAVVAIGSYVAPIASSIEEAPGMVSIAKIFSLPEAKTEMRRFTFLAANGTTPLNLDFYPPATSTASSAPAPWILVIHGGGWINGSSEQLPELNWYLAKRGYGVISIDYRLSPAWLWPAPQEDVMKALEFINTHATEWHLDTSRWAILGRSAGAQIAGVVAYSLHGNARPKGFISFYDPTDLVFGYGVGKEDDILKSRTLLRGFLGGAPAEAKERYESSSVMRAVTQDACPTLLIHGEKDYLVWVKHTERLYKVLQDHGIEAHMVILKFGPHGFDFFFNGPEAQVSTNAVTEFLEHVLPIASK